MFDAFIPVLIIGAGPTGLTVANLLGLHGVQALLIERNPELAGFQRAVAIDDDGLRICQALGLRSEVLEHVKLDMGARYLSRGRVLASVRPRSRRNGYPLISTFRQPDVEAALLGGLGRFAGVEVRFGQTLESIQEKASQVLVTIRTADGGLERLSCGYVLACDGGKSLVRHSLGIKQRGTTFPQRWLVVDSICRGVVPLADYITFFCDPARPAVSVPGPGQNWRWEFMLHRGEASATFLAPESISRLLHALGETREPEIQRRSVYTFHATCATAFARGNIFLLGDAAHQMPPFGGQGMNCGLRDAHNLAWKLALVVKRQASPALLATYQEERVPHTRRLLRFSTFLGGIIMSAQAWRAFVRDVVLRSAGAVPSVAGLFSEMRIKPEPVYRRGFLARGVRGYAGQLLPQPLLTAQSGQEVLLDELLGHDFALLRLCAVPGEAFVPLRCKLWERLKPRTLCIVPQGAQQPAESEEIAWARDNGDFADFVCGEQELFLLVRPDRYIYGAFRSKQEAAFVHRLTRWLTV